MQKQILPINAYIINDHDHTIRDVFTNDFVFGGIFGADVYHGNEGDHYFNALLTEDMKARVVNVLNQVYSSNASDTMYFAFSNGVFHWSTGDAIWMSGEGEGSAKLKYGNNYAGGIASVAYGSGNNAYSDYSVAHGYGSNASGTGSHTEGYSTNALGDYSHAEGYIVDASGLYSHAEGEYCKAWGQGSHAEGYGAIAAAYASHAEGHDTQAKGEHSHAEGHDTMTFGEKSHSEGFSTFAFGNAAHTEGLGVSTSTTDKKHIVRITGDVSTTSYTTSASHNLKPGDLLSYNPVGYIPSNIRNIAKVLTTPTATSFTVDNTLNSLIAFSDTSVVNLRGIATATASHAEGYCTKATGVGSHSEGYYTRTDSSYSHAEGENTDASGIGSHTEGYYTNTFANYSHAEGRYTRTSNMYEHAQGSYNMSHNYNATFGNSGNTLDSIGIGVSDASRSNAIEVMQNGDVYVKGVGSYDGSNYVDASTLQEVINSGGGSADLMTSITYTDLKNLRDTSALIPGMQYRITDYVCTTTQADTSVAGNVFDIIVTADSSTELNENVRAAHHEGDTYFQNCDLDTWELKYCLDNDTDRFAWADDTNGKGVIYYMKDEWNNECLYDFKNIKFQRWAITACPDCSSLVVDNLSNIYGYYYGAKSLNGGNVLNNATYGEDNGYFYTFALKDLESGEWLDYTVVAHLGLKNDEGNEMACYDNYLTDVTDEYNSGKGEIAKMLNNIVFFNCYTDLSDTSYADDYSYCNNNRFLRNCHSNTFGNSCYSNTFGNSCRQNSFGNYCYSNSFEDFCHLNTFGDFCQFNSFEEFCYFNSFGNSCYSNTFGNSCRQNSFGNNCHSNSLGNGCRQNSFGNYCQAITVFDNVEFCIITGGTNTSSVQNAQILNGTKGASNTNRLTITFMANQNYTQIAGLNSSGVLKIWAPADLID